MSQLNSLIGSLTTPSNVLCLLLVLGCLTLALGRRRVGLSLITACTILLLTIGFLPVSSLLILPLEDRFPQPVLPDPDRVAGIVVLGGSVAPELSKARGQPVVKNAADRLFSAAALARQFPAARVILSGGIVVPRPGSIPEAWVMRDVLAAVGIDPARLEVETNSRNTCENAEYSVELAKPAPGSVWLLVTSANHMPRSVACFRKWGFAVMPYPTDYLTQGKLVMKREFNVAKELSQLDLAAHEWVGLVGYRLLGWTDEVFPGP